MPSVDYATCDINDVIMYSLKLHSRRFSDCLRAHARVHAQFADAYDNREVTGSELDLAGRLCSFADAVDLGDYTIPHDLDVRHKAFSCAAQLHDLHPIMQQVITEREDAQNARPSRGG